MEKSKSNSLIFLTIENNNEISIISSAGAILIYNNGNVINGNMNYYSRLINDYIPYINKLNISENKRKQAIEDIKGYIKQYPLTIFQKRIKK